MLRRGLPTPSPRALDGDAVLAEAAADFRLAERALEPHAGDPRATEALVSLHFERVGLAEFLAERGDGDAAGRTRPPVRDLLRRLVPKASDDPMRQLSDALIRFRAEPTEAVTAAASAAVKRLPADARLPPSVELTLADLIARELCASTEAGEGRRLPPEAVAERLRRDLDSALEDLRLHPDAHGLIVEQIGLRGGLQEIAARRSGRLDDARRTVAWMVALGRALQRRHAESGGPHLLLSRAFEPEAKIAWTGPDRVAIERALRAALCEATIASDLDPGNMAARQHLAGIREKYLRLVAVESGP